MRRGIFSATLLSTNFACASSQEPPQPPVAAEAETVPEEVLSDSGPPIELIPNEQTKPCDRKQSRAVRRTVHKDVLAMAQERDYELPKKCPFRPQNDRFNLHEQHKTRIRASLWECGICKKQFKSEEYLDQHFERKHIQLSTGVTCLEDYCGLFGVCKVNGMAYAPTCEEVPRYQDLCLEAAKACWRKYLASNLQNFRVIIARCDLFKNIRTALNFIFSSALKFLINFCVRFSTQGRDI